MEQVRSARSRGVELSVRAQVCAGKRAFWLGDLISYRSMLWLVKGLYVSTGRSGMPEVYYILAESSPSLDVEDEVETR